MSHTKVTSTPPEDSSKKDSLLSKLTFNLSLTDRQKQAKSEVHLPYLRAQEVSDSTLVNRQQDSWIVYHSDIAEEFDEDDPDADLDL